MNDCEPLHQPTAHSDVRGTLGSVTTGLRGPHTYENAHQGTLQ